MLCDSQGWSSEEQESREDWNLMLRRKRSWLMTGAKGILMIWNREKARKKQNVKHQVVEEVSNVISTKALYGGQETANEEVSGNSEWDVNRTESTVPRDRRNNTRMKEVANEAFSEKEIRMLWDNICWEKINDNFSTRNFSNCRIKWYGQSTSTLMITAWLMHLLTWDNLIDHRPVRYVGSNWTKWYIT